MQVEVGNDSVDEKEKDQDVGRARERLKKLRDLPVELRDLVVGGFDNGLADLQDKLEEALAARRAAHPLAKQLQSSQAHLDKISKNVLDSEAALTALAEQQRALEENAVQQKVALDEARAAKSKAEAEVATLAAKCAASWSPPPASGGDNQSTPPGCVSLEFAERKWLERERAFAAQLAELQLLVAQNQGPSQTPSEACDTGDVASLASLDEFADGDGEWKQVAKNRLRALLNLEKYALARRVRASLGKVKPADASPFKKGA